MPIIPYQPPALDRSGRIVYNTFALTAHNRIALNVVATYGRNLYALVIGLFCGRWTLMALGETDYGLVGVIGGLIGFVAFLNDLLADAVSRFYAVAVGEAQKDGASESGLENCRRWFSVALLVHMVLSTLLVAGGYPFGVWAIEHYLVIPPDRVAACLWVWRFSCFACFLGMASVPFSAMYRAKQEIAELTVYGFVTTTLNATILYYMVTHPGTWLITWSAWSCGLSVLPQLLICTRAFLHFPECRLRPDSLLDARRLRELFVYAGGRFFCALAQMFSSQGTVAAVNKLLGPAKNAAMTVGNTVVVHASTLAVSCVNALTPAIANAVGRGDESQMRTLAYRMCKLSAFAAICFALPLILEADNVLILWLKQPPEEADVLCALILAAGVVNHLTDGLWAAIFAKGRVTAFNLSESAGFFLGFFAAIFLMNRGCGLASVGYGLLIAHSYALAIKLVFGRRLCGLSLRHWLRRIFLPLATTCLLAIVAAGWPRFVLPPTFLRAALTTCLAESVLLTFAWCAVLDADEKDFLRIRLAKLFRRAPA